MHSEEKRLRFADTPHERVVRLTEAADRLAIAREASAKEESLRREEANLENLTSKVATHPVGLTCLSHEARDQLLNAFVKHMPTFTNPKTRNKGSNANPLSR